MDESLRCAVWGRALPEVEALTWDGVRVRSGIARASSSRPERQLRFSEVTR
ncbi:hypothetical protein Kisp02_26240 [Kineosporia sp. NBRC 101731]|nr:hypothetical protein Kisp02_26240 [Kineosporia sp. NBRC 101731]